MSVMGERIAQKRKEKNMTMEELARVLGVQASAINKYEKGLVENIKRSTIQEMAKIFECDPVWLMGYDPVVKNDSDILTEDEKTLIEMFRNADQTTKEMVSRILKFSKIEEA